MSARRRPFIQSWEATYAADLTLDQIRRRGAALGGALAQRGARCLVAYDTRFLANLFARTLASDLAGLGVTVALAAAPAPLAAIHHALDSQQADCALYVSARNRPYYMGGLVLVAAEGTGLHLGPASEPPAPATFPLPPGDEPGVDLRGPYLDGLRSAIDLEQIRRVAMTIFVDAMAGTTAGAVPALLGEGGQTRAIEINREADPLFARGSPQPTEASLVRLRKLVRESDSHLGLAIAGDGTALAVVDKSGDLLDPTETALLLAGYLARQHRQRGLVLAAPPAAGSPLGGGLQLAAWQDETGLSVELTADPAGRAEELRAADRAPLLVATAQGELTLGRVSACPDGLLAGMLVAELVARSGTSLRAQIDGLRAQLLRGAL